MFRFLLHKKGLIIGNTTNLLDSYRGIGLRVSGYELRVAEGTD
jgi:hypothetical protein